MTDQHVHSKVNLSGLGLETSGEIFWNLTPAELYEHAVMNNEAIMTAHGALRVLTGKFTGRSPKDKFVVDTPDIHDDIWWGSVNQPVSEDVFDNLYKFL